MSQAELKRNSCCKFGRLIRQVRYAYNGIAKSTKEAIATPVTAEATTTTTTDMMSKSDV